MRIRSLKLLLVTFLVSTAPVAEAVTYHVSPFGSNTPPYDTYTNAAHRIIDATRLATGSGDTVLVHTGSYDVDSTLFIARGVTWMGAGRDSTIVVWTSLEYGSTILARLYGRNEVAQMCFHYPFGTANLEALALWAHSYPSADTILIRDCRFQWFRLALSGNTHGLIHDNEFYHRGADGIWTSSQFADIRHNLFSGADGGEHQAGVGIDVFDGGVVQIIGNVFDNSRRPDGSQAQGSRTRAEIYVHGAAEVIIRNNLIRQTERPFDWFYADGVIENNTIIDAIDIYTSPPTSDALFFQRASQTLVIRNNLFLDVSARLRFGLECDDCDSTGWIHLSYNAYWPPTDSFFTIYRNDPPWKVKVFDSANVNAFPMLKWDSLLQLQAGSPLIDAGHASILDVDGTQSDIGWTGGPLGYIYSYPELPPFAPDTIRASGDGLVVLIRWSARPEGDLSGYRLYRGEAPGFWNLSPSPLWEFGPEITRFWDTLPSTSSSIYCVITAFDLAGLASSPSSEAEYIVGSHSPRWSPIPDQELIVGNTLELAVTASDPDGDPLVLSTLDPPTNASFGDLGQGEGLFRFTPDSSQVGEFEVHLVASDGLLSDTLVLQILVRSDSSGQTPTISHIVKAYPNPIRSIGFIDLRIAGQNGDERNVEIVVCDILGRRVASVYSDNASPGEHTIPLDLSERSETADFASGVYFLLLKVDSRVVGSPYKMAVIK